MRESFERLRVKVDTSMRRGTGPLRAPLRRGEEEEEVEEAAPSSNLLSAFAAAPEATPVL